VYAERVLAKPELLLVLVSWSAAAASCASEPVTTGCASDADCPLFMRCEGRMCVAVTPADASAVDAPEDSAMPPDPLDAEVSACAGDIRDSVEDFSLEQGHCGWRYGYIAPATDARFVEMTVVQTDTWWVDPLRFWTHIGRDVMHPNGVTTGGGREPVDHYAVRRWTSDASGTVSIAFDAARPDATCGNGVLVRLVVDDIVVTEKALDPGLSTTSFSADATVSAGTIIDFVVDPRESQDGCDSTRLVARITRR